MERLVRNLRRRLPLSRHHWLLPQLVWRLLPCQPLRLRVGGSSVLSALLPRQRLLDLLRLVLVVDWLRLWRALPSCTLL